ncbi:fimbrillin family protein [Bacteroides faecalis]|uniref:fimbrillin family protein n=1 Tax=Bacteroides faecalis TaxID=2447885 RepID=UPI000F61CE73|nr:fimbrillin family protein [Bacteroides faecalis]
MRTKILLPSIYALCLCLLCGCNSGEEPGVPGEGVAHLAPLIVNGAMEGEAEPVTRAATTITSGSIGVFLADAASGNYEPRANACYTYNTTEGKWASDDALFFSEADANVCAYYPYDADRTDSHAIKLTTQKYDAAKDLSFAVNSTMNATSNSVTFNMNHAYALMEINLKRENIKDDISFEKIDIVATGLNASNTVDITNDTYSTPTACPDGKFTYRDDAAISLPKNTNAVQCKVLLVPTGTLTGGTKFSFTLDDAESTTMSVTITSLTQYEKKKKYIVNLTVNGTEVVTQSVTVKPWTEVSVGTADAPVDVVC